MVTHAPKVVAYADVKHYLKKGLLSVAPLSQGPEALG